ncbi:MAG TPA: carbohydrate kinase family protein [Candidatus Pacebacteria bacterium]|nr:carbohydrate kinase family protein [Candidatus Paceibacterota bacterium]
MTKTSVKLPQLVLTGSISVDQIMRFEGLLAEQLSPAQLKSLSLSVLLSRLDRSRGGIAANIGYNLGLLGEKPILLAAIGDDQKAYLDQLAAQGLDVSRCHVSELPTASFTVLTDKAGCQIGGFYPGAMAEAQTLTLNQFSDQSILVVLSAHDPAQMAIQITEAQDQKLRLVFDLGQQVASLDPKVIKQGLAVAEVLILNEYEFSLLQQRTGLTQAEILKLVPITVVTLGEQGCVIYDRAGISGTKVKVKAVSAKAVDPTGAGDAFRAGFLFGFIRGWDLVTAARLGATGAAFAVEATGTQNHRYSRAEIDLRHQIAYGHHVPWHEIKELNYENRL